MSILNALPRDTDELLNGTIQLHNEFRAAIHGPTAQRVRLRQGSDQEQEQFVYADDTAFPMNDYLRVVRRMEIAQPEFFQKLLAITPGKLHAYFTYLPGLEFTTSAQQTVSWIADKTLLLTIVRAYKNVLEAEGHPGYDRGQMHFSLPNLMFGFDASDSVVFRGATSLNVINSEPGVIRRFRECPICGEFYWAKRIGGNRGESTTCQEKKCSNNYHQRKRRIDQYEDRLSNERTILLRIEQKGLAPTNTILTDQQERVRRLEEKIRVERTKNGELFF